MLLLLARVPATTPTLNNSRLHLHLQFHDDYHFLPTSSTSTNLVVVPTVHLVLLSQ